MPRVKHAVATKRRKKKVLARAKCFCGARSRLYRTAQEAVNRAEAYAYRDRRVRKGPSERAAEPTDSAPSSASKARKPKAAKSRQDNAGSASTAMVPIGNGEQTPMGASAITPATGLAGAAASPKNMGISPMRGVNLSPASPHITGQKLSRSCLQCPSLCRRRTTRTTMWTRTATPTMTRTTSPSSTRAARAPTTST